jgi:hypothetical protein
VSGAGSYAAVMRRQGLDLPMRSASEWLLLDDLRNYRWYEALSPEPAEPFSQARIRLAADTLEAHRLAFPALVDALLVRGELDAAQVWERATASDRQELE